MYNAHVRCMLEYRAFVDLLAVCNEDAMRTMIHIAPKVCDNIKSHTHTHTSCRTDQTPRWAVAGNSSLHAPHLNVNRRWSDAVYFEQSTREIVGSGVCVCITPRLRCKLPPKHKRRAGPR